MPTRTTAGSMSIHFLTLVLLVFFVSDALVHAQSRQMLESESAPTSSSQTSTLVPGQAPASQPVSPSAYPSKPNDTYLYHVGAFCGIGASTSPAASKPAAGCGAGMTLVPLPVFIEVGIMVPKRTVAIFPDTSVWIAVSRLCDPRPSICHWPSSVIAVSLKQAMPLTTASRWLYPGSTNIGTIAKVSASN